MTASQNQKEFITHPLIQEETLIRRAYQENIFINCLNHNSLVVIPTGLGKTIIALMLAVHRLTEYPKSKVIFLAPTKPLVNQHYETFKDLTTIDSEALKSITGSISPDERKELWSEVKIAFMTPQVLQNDIISNHYSLDGVSLIIFDECHRAVGDYAYCFLAKKYIDSSNHPQILGLTASPGSTEQKINEIKQNLFIDHIEIRTEKDPDVKPYVHNVDRTWIKVDLPKEFEDIIKILEDKLRSFYKQLKQMELINSYDTNKVTRRDLLKLNKRINYRIASAQSQDEKYNLFYAKKLQANAIRLSHMAELIETQGINALIDYIDKNIEKIKRNKANKSLKELFRNYDIKQLINLANQIKSQGIIHPKIDKLKDILKNQIENNTESRILVFCHYRDSVNNLVKVFENSDKIKVHRFVGQAKKGSKKGLTQKEQIEILDKFRQGIYNTLIGTSVAEEGLDIAECDLVVFYDVVPSAIRSIQRRGRTGRKKEGKVFVLMAKGTRDEGYYWAERTKEKNMRRSLNKMKQDQKTSKGEKQKSLLSFAQEHSEDESSDKSSKSKIRLNNSNDVEKIEGAEGFKILCDNRETASSVVRNLSLMGLDLELEQLEVADYIISNRTGIERKASKDFSDSIKDGRLFKELIDLKNNFERPILILEEDPFIETNINQNAIYGAISSIILNLGITVYRTKDSQETAMFLYQLAKKEQTDNKTPVKSRFEKAPTKISYLLEHIISGIPGINTLRAKNLLSELKTLQRLFNADIGELMKVENVGKKIAQEIYKLSRFKYNPD
ncbi:MAG: DEAD/DEAH box helicase [Promethearchaeota archaeon]|nr:MAG: DEAD/DEAH box helicase [Candidatus Lokiarchaeota archaeon]